MHSESFRYRFESHIARPMQTLDDETEPSFDVSIRLMYI